MAAMVIDLQEAETDLPEKDQDLQDSGRQAADRDHQAVVRDHPETVRKECLQSSVQPRKEERFLSLEWRLLLFL